MTTKTKTTPARRRLKYLAAFVYAVAPVFIAGAGWIGADPYLFALGLMLVFWQGIVYIGDQIVKAIQAGSREVCLTIEQPFREKLNDALGMARIRPTARRDQ